MIPFLVVNLSFLSMHPSQEILSLSRPLNSAVPFPFFSEPVILSFNGIHFPVNLPLVALEWPRLGHQGRIPDLNLVNLQLSDTRLFSVLVIVPFTPWVWIRKFGLTPPSVINEPCLLQQWPKLYWNFIGYTCFPIRKRAQKWYIIKNV